MIVTRLYFIDFIRFILAFLVVTIHVECFCHIVISPISRIAVPLFYMISGYFLYSSQENNLKIKLWKYAKKWLFLWLTYFALFFFISYFFNVFLHNNQNWEFDDTKSLFIIGANRFIDEIVFNDSTYGIETIWFLYGGGISFLFLRFLLSIMPFKYFNYIILFIGVVLGLVYPIFINYGIAERYDILALALPFISLGYIVMRYNKTILICCKRIYIGLVLTLLLWYFEWHYYNALYTGFFLSLLCLYLFLFIINFREQNKFKFIDKFKPSLTLDIYIYHRLVYFIIILMGGKFGNYSAIVCFLLTYLLAYVFKTKLKKIWVSF